MKTKTISILIISLLICGLTTYFPLVPADGLSTSTSFIVFSDTHLGAGIGSGDLFDSAVRLQMLLLTAGLYGKCNIMVNCGDLTNENQKEYARYRNLTANYLVYNVKGNHDANLTKYTQVIGDLNWCFKSGEMLFVGVGCLSNSEQDWITKGICYSAVTYAFLSNVFKSLDYTTTKYHYLFMHFGPDSTWPMDASHGVPAKFSAYLDYFTMVFYGHEGGKEQIRFWNNETPIVKASHLADGTIVTDTFLMVHLNRETNMMSVVVHNFVTGAAYQLWKGAVRP
jgi:hypothetical protein